MNSKRINNIEIKKSESIPKKFIISSCSYEVISLSRLKKCSHYFHKRIEDKHLKEVYLREVQLYFCQLDPNQSLLTVFLESNFNCEESSINKIRFKFNYFIQNFLLQSTDLESFNFEDKEFKSPLDKLFVYYRMAVYENEIENDTVFSKNQKTIEWGIEESARIIESYGHYFEKIAKIDYVTLCYYIKILTADKQLSLLPNENGNTSDLVKNLCTLIKEKYANLIDFPIVLQELILKFLEAFIDDVSTLREHFDVFQNLYEAKLKFHPDNEKKFSDLLEVTASKIQECYTDFSGKTKDTRCYFSRERIIKVI